MVAASLVNPSQKRNGTVSKIAFIGLGNMGGPMAANLRNAGHEITGYDALEATRAARAGEGLVIAESGAAAAAGADIAVLMLPDGKIVETVGAGVLPVMAQGTLLIDCSTIDVETARKLHGMAANAGVLCLDAPVSGGVGGAAAGTLTFMVGGSEAAFSKGEQAFGVMGRKAVHCGGGGAGQAAKICNNMLLAISMIGASEAFNLAERLGLSQAALFDVISTSSGSCWSVNTYCPVPGVGPQSPADNDYRPGFSAELMLKDLGLSQRAADASGTPTPLGAHALSLYQAMVDADTEGADFSGVVNFLKSQRR